jgi:hypothetical protein
VRVARGWQDDRVRLDAGFMRGTADEGFTSVDAGLELRACGSACRVVPFVGVGLGGITDNVGAAPMPRLTFGVDVKLSRRHLLRAGVLRSTHGKGSTGPNGLVFGFSHRF